MTPGVLQDDVKIRWTSLGSRGIQEGVREKSRAGNVKGISFACSEFVPKVKVIPRKKGKSLTLFWMVVIIVGFKYGLGGFT